MLGLSCEALYDIVFFLEQLLEGEELVLHGALFTQVALFIEETHLL